MPRKPWKMILMRTAKQEIPLKNEEAEKDEGKNNLKEEDQEGMHWSG